MGRDNSPKVRQKADLARKRARSRTSHDRILIVSEGTKTEPNYLNEICHEYRIPTANVVVQPGKDGTGPLQVVRYAQRLFTEGDHHCGIFKKAFEWVYAVFDRDEHASYEEAIQLAGSLDRSLRNDLREKIRFLAVASVPCFELWLLLHFEDVHSPIERSEVLRRLRRHLPEYEKGSNSVYALTKGRLQEAIRRARRLQANHDCGAMGEGPFTTVHELVHQLTTMGQSR
jgi:hypothetical protein